MRGPPTIVKVVDGHLRGPHDGPPYQDAGSRQPAITVVVERPAVANLDWLTIESAQLPTTASVDHQGCVERLTQIGSVAHRQEPLQIDVNELAPRSQRQRATTERVGDPDEGLLHIEPVLIKLRAHSLAQSICALNLREDLEVLPEPKVGVRFQSAEQPLSLYDGGMPKTRRGWSLEASPRIEPQRQIRSTASPRPQRAPWPGACDPSLAHPPRRRPRVRVRDRRGRRPPRPPAGAGHRGDGRGDPRLGRVPSRDTLTSRVSHRVAAGTTFVRLVRRPRT